MKIITRSEMVWDRELQQYVVAAEESHDYVGPVAECKRGGAKGIIGLVGALAIPFAAPAISAAMGVSTTVAGAAMGAGLGVISGGGWKGALMGGIGGGLAGYSAGGGNFFGEGGLFGGGPSAGASGLNVGAGATSGGFTIDPTNLSGGTFTSVGPGSFGGTVAGDFGMGFGAGAGAGAGLSMSPGVVNLANSGGPLLSAGGATGGSSMFSAFDPTDFSSISTDFSGLGNTSFSGSNIGGGNPGVTDLGNSGGPNVPAGAEQTAPKPGMFDGLGRKIGEQAVNAGIKLGAQYIGNSMTPTPEGLDTETMNSYLKDQMQMQDQVFDMNKAQHYARNDSADAVDNIANNYDPRFLGLNAQAQSKNRDTAAWQDMEAKMRAQGYSEQQISAERNRFQLGASQNAATAYTGGVDAGYKTQTGMHATGAGIRTDMNGPGSSSIDDLLALYNTNNKDKQAAGSAIEQIFQPVGNTTTTGTEDTRNRRIPAEE